MTKRELATALECTPRWIDRLVQAGMPKEARGAFDFLKASAWYARYLQAAIAKRNGPNEVSISLSHDRLRLMRAQAQRLEWEAEKLRCELLPLSTLAAVEADMAEVTPSFRR